MIHRTTARPAEAPAAAAFGDILAGLSHALDIAAGHPKGHSARSCLIGMRLAHIVGLRLSERTHLFHALLLKDAGCSSTATSIHQLLGGNELEAKHAFAHLDWRNLPRQVGYVFGHAGRNGSVGERFTQPARVFAAGSQERRQFFHARGDRGADVAARLGLSETTAAAIRAMHEHWDGRGEPRGLRGANSPLLARIITLAQVVEIVWHDHHEAAALDIAARRNGRWFDPDLVRALGVLANDTEFWQTLRTEDARLLVIGTDPDRFAHAVGEPGLDAIAETFGAIIDAKSTVTSGRSGRLALIASAIATRLRFSTIDVVRIRRAALLQDIGMLGVPNSILDKPAALTPWEWAAVREHPEQTRQILEAVPVFQDFAFDAACHHERLDGSGYSRSYLADRLSPAARALAVAAVAEALLSKRAYRAAFTPGEALQILRAESVRGALCAASVAAVTDIVDSWGSRSEWPDASGRMAI